MNGPFLAYLKYKCICLACNPSKVFISLDCVVAFVTVGIKKLK